MVRLAGFIALALCFCGGAVRAGDELTLPEWSVAPSSRDEWLKQEKARRAAEARRAKAQPATTPALPPLPLELPQAQKQPARATPGSATPARPGSATAARPGGVAAPAVALPSLSLPAAAAPAPAVSHRPAAPASATPASTRSTAPATARGATPATARGATPASIPASAAGGLASRSASAPPPALVPLVEPAAPDARGDKHGFFLGLRLGLLVPSGRPDNATAGAGADVPTARRAFTVPVSLQAGYRLPWLSRDLALVAEGGYYPLSSSGSRSFPQDPQFTTLSYSYKATQIPLFAGLEYRLPFLLPGFLSRLSLSAGGGFAAVWSNIVSTYSAEGVTDAPQKGWALGFSADAGASLQLGPGQLTFDLRYVNARTDLRMQSLYPGQPWNARKGDVQGTNYLLGYRLAL